MSAPVAILGCMLLLHRGCQVWVYSRGPKTDPRARLVESVGARYVSSGAVTFAELNEEIYTFLKQADARELGMMFRDLDAALKQDGPRARTARSAR